jgi:hypothetical protein
MVADYMAKPLVGAKFEGLCKIIMNSHSSHFYIHLLARLASRSVLDNICYHEHDYLPYLSIMNDKISLRIPDTTTTKDQKQSQGQ